MERRVKIYHPKYGIIDQRYFRVYCVSPETGECEWASTLYILSNDQLLALMETQLETENYEGARLIQNEFNKRNAKKI